MDLVQLGKEIVIEDVKVTDIGMMFITFVLSLCAYAIHAQGFWLSWFLIVLDWMKVDC